MNHILVVADDDRLGMQLQERLHSSLQLKVQVVDDMHLALRALQEPYYVLAVVRLPQAGLDGLDWIRQMQRRHASLAVIVTSASGDSSLALEAIRRGAHDCLAEPVDIDRLLLATERALLQHRLQEEVAHLRNQLQKACACHTILSKNPEVHSIFELIENLGYTGVPVLVEGETGTGKEQVARAIHQCSVSRPGPFVAVNCAALPDVLLESELFGHEAAAFSGATNRRLGALEIAKQGTLFLDDVGSLSAALQGRVLRLLDEGRFDRAGGSEPLQADVRVIAASSRPLRRMVKQGAFREDLYGRLNGVRIRLPPLRQRPEDILLLATHFAQQYSRPSEPVKQISSAAMQHLLSYRWPGNVRELERVIERACVTSRGPVIEASNLPPDLTSAALEKTPCHVSFDRPLPEVLRAATASIERQYLRKVLKKVHGNVVRAAKICGLSRRSVTAKLADYGINRLAFKEA